MRYSASRPELKSKLEPTVGVQAAMGGKEESEMRGLSVFFVASVLPSLIRGVGDIYGLYTCDSQVARPTRVAHAYARR